MPHDLPKKPQETAEMHPMEHMVKLADYTESAREFNTKLSDREAREAAAVYKARHMLLAEENALLKARLQGKDEEIAVLEVSYQLAKEELAEAQRKALYEVMTGLYNKETWYRLLKGNIERARRENTPISVIVVDLDKFKQINDRVGHIVGDTAIKILGEMIKDPIREYDIAARFGGEEFVIMLPNTSKAEALIAAERLRAKIEHEFKNRLLDAHPEKADQINGDGTDERTGETVPNVVGTTSVGVATFSNKEKMTASNKEMTAQKLFEKADEALTKGAKTNRNAVVHFDDLEAGRQSAAGVKEAAKKLMNLDENVVNALLKQFPDGLDPDIREAYARELLRRLAA